MSEAFAEALKHSVDGEVLLGAGDRALYAADASNYREVPLGVVVPRSIEAIAAAVGVCARHGVSIVHRGGGTSLCGQTVSKDSIVIDSSKYCGHVVGIDAEARLAVVEPGCIRDHLCDEAAPHGLMFGPDPSTHNHNTIGGMIGNNSCGTHSITCHRTSDNIHSLEILTYDGARLMVGATGEKDLSALCGVPGRVGEIYAGLRRIRDFYGDEIRARYPRIPRRVSGYNLDELLPEKGFHLARALVGSEGTCVSVLRATVHLVPDPPFKIMLLAGFDAIEHAGDAVPRLLTFKPFALEAIDDQLIGYLKKKNMLLENIRHLPDGNSWLYIQFGGATREEAMQRSEDMQQALQQMPHVAGVKLLDDAAEYMEVKAVREAGLGATAWVPGMRDTWEGWEDSAVHPDRLGAYIRDFKELFRKYGYSGAIYGHFGDGLVHTRIDSGLHSEGEVTHFRRYLEEAAQLVVRHGGSLSGEHGDGRSKAELLPIMFGSRLIEAFQEFKQVWDPLNRMNPGKIVWPKPITSDLRYGPDYEKRKTRLDAAFHYPESGDVFERAAMRCVGIGECRRRKKGVMCPSYRATLDERHSTRGRARLLQEMSEGDPVRDAWQSEEVKKSLDLCLSCKGCKAECPVHVDMAVYRAEFLHHYHQTKIRPLASFSMGLVHRWAPFASHAPWLINAVTQWPVLGSVAKFVGGVHQARALPAMAASTFRKQWGRGNSTTTAVRALLWVDTFNNYFTPQILLAAARLLERCGYGVALAPEGLCCGRPYYDFGRLDAARAMLAQLVAAVAPLLDDKTWIVGVEASCLSVFREELLRFFPDEPQAKRIAERTLTLGAFLQKHGHPDFRFPQDVVMHAHCHHRSIFGAQPEIELLKSSGREVELLDAGCCGMAGAFGYERGKYDVSKAIAAQGIVPALAERNGKIIVSDGFSCRHQIADFAGRATVSLPELLLQSMEA